MEGQREDECCENDDEEDDDYIPSDTEADKGSFADCIAGRLSSFGTKSLLFEDENSDGDESDEYPPKQKSEDCSIETETAKLSDSELKKKVDDIWADLCKDSNRIKKLPSKELNPEDTVRKQETSEKTAEKPTKSVVRVFEFAGEEVKVEQDVVPDEKVDKATNSKAETQKSFLPAKRSGSGLGDLLATINKKPKLSTLLKTKIDWHSFKKSEGFEDELDQHRRSKDSFVERQAFLQRSDVREFENERSIREKSRRSK